MLICAIHKALVDIREKNSNLALLLIRESIVIHNFLVKL